MNTQTRSIVARTAAFVVAASITAVTTTVVAPPTSASAPAQERPCFFVQPRWNTAVDGPVPTCPTTSWQQAAAPREVATIADCMDTSYRPVVTTCPYPVTSGGRFSSAYRSRSTSADEHDGPER